MKCIWKIIKEWLLCRYEIGFLDNTVDDIINGRPLNMKLMKHNFKDRWFADPFILEVTDNTIELLVEEYYYPEQKGRIGLYIVDRKDYTLLSATPVLSLDYHLSFPLIRREGDRVFVIPESENAGILNKYEYDKNLNISKLANALSFWSGANFYLDTSEPSDNDLYVKLMSTLSIGASVIFVLSTLKS